MSAKRPCCERPVPGRRGSAPGPSPCRRSRPRRRSRSPGSAPCVGPLRSQVRSLEPDALDSAAPRARRPVGHGQPAHAVRRARRPAGRRRRGAADRPHHRRRPVARPFIRRGDRRRVPRPRSSTASACSSPPAAVSRTSSTTFNGCRSVELSKAAAAELFASLRIDDAVFTRCWEATGGNPLALDVLAARPRRARAAWRSPAARSASGRRFDRGRVPIAALEALAGGDRSLRSSCSPPTPASSPTALLRRVADARPRSRRPRARRGCRDRRARRAADRSSPIPSCGRARSRRRRRRSSAPHTPRSPPPTRRPASSNRGPGSSPPRRRGRTMSPPTRSPRSRRPRAAARRHRGRGRGLPRRGPPVARRDPSRVARLLAAGDATWVVGRVDEATEILGRGARRVGDADRAGRGGDAARQDRAVGARSRASPVTVSSAPWADWSTTTRASRRG